MNTVPRDAAPASVTGLDRDYLSLGAVGAGPQPYDVPRNKVPEGVPFMAGQTLNAPPLCTTPADVDEIVSTLQAAVAHETSP